MAKRIWRKNKHQSHARRKQRRWTLKALVTRTGGLCEYCREPIEMRPGPRQATIDHVIPRSSGGLDVIDNLRLACHECNQEKGSGVSIDVFVEAEEA